MAHIPPSATAPASTVPASTVQDARTGLIDLPDGKLLRVVAMIDALPRRGPADQMLEPVRPRLAMLRPDRPMGLMRLLFLPLDPLIVPPARWRPGSGTVPRTAIEPMTRAVRAALGDAAGDVDAMILGATTRSLSAIRRAGAALWPQAAKALAAAPIPHGWTDAGFRDNAFGPLAAAVAGVLAQIDTIHALGQDMPPPPEAPPPERVEAALLAWTREPPEVQAMLLSLLLHALPRVGPILRRLTTSSGNARSHPGLRVAAEQGAATLMRKLETAGGMESPIGRAPLAEAASEARQLIELVDTLEEAAATRNDRDRVRELRTRLDQACQARFNDGMSAEFIAPLESREAPVDRDTQAAMEASARRLRDLETEGRKIGGAARYGAVLDQASGTLDAVGAKGFLTLARRIRLTEILLGPQAAFQLLGPAAIF